MADDVRWENKFLDADKILLPREMRSSSGESGFEQFRCFGNKVKQRFHGPGGRLVVEVNWERRIVKKRCDDCKQMHIFISQEARDGDEGSTT